MERKKIKKSLITFLLLFNDLTFGKTLLICNVMVTVMQSMQSSKIGYGAQSNFDSKFKNEHCHQISSPYFQK